MKFTRPYKNLMVCAARNRSACMYAQARLLVLSYRGYVKREDPGF